MRIFWIKISHINSWFIIRKSVHSSDPRKVWHNWETVDQLN